MLGSLLGVMMWPPFLFLQVVALAGTWSHLYRFLTPSYPILLASAFVGVNWLQRPAPGNGGGHLFSTPAPEPQWWACPRLEPST